MNWIEVKPGQLPLVNQQIFYVIDRRGSPQEWRDRLWNKAIENLSLEQRAVHVGGNRYFELFGKTEDRRVIVAQGWVDDRYPDCFTVRNVKDPTKVHHHSVRVFNDVELITHWAPIDWPAPPTLDLSEEEYSQRYDARRAALEISSRNETDFWNNDDQAAYNKAHSMELPV